MIMWTFAVRVTKSIFKKKIGQIKSSDHNVGSIMARLVYIAVFCRRLYINLSTNSKSASSAKLCFFFDKDIQVKVHSHYIIQQFEHVERACLDLF